MALTRRRKRRSSGADGIVELLALCPWWVGVTAAGVAYIGLHALAMAPVPPANAGQAIHTNVLWIFIKVLSGFGQYVLPGLFLFGAGVSALRRQSRQRLFDEAAQRGAAAKVVNGLSWQQFEQLIGEAFRREGWAGAGDRGRWRRWWRGPAVEQGWRDVSCAVQALAGLARGGGGGAGALWGDGGRGGGGWVCGEFGEVHGRG